MIRMGTLKPGLERFAGTLRGLRDGMLGTAYVTIQPRPDSRREGGTNTAVLAHLVHRNPELMMAMDAPARRAAREAWRTGVRTLATLAEHAARGVARELAGRLRSGQYVHNLDETRDRKRARGDDSTPGMATGQLARALEHAQVKTER